MRLRGMRGERLAEEIHRELADILASRVRDPRLGLATVTRVEVSTDGSHARVFVSFLGDELADASGLQALDERRGLHPRRAGAASGSPPRAGAGLSRSTRGCATASASRRSCASWAWTMRPGSSARRRSRPVIRPDRPRRTEAMRPPAPSLGGFVLNVYKEIPWTSHDAVARVRRILDTRRSAMPGASIRLPPEFWSWRWGGPPGSSSTSWTSRRSIAARCSSGGARPAATPAARWWRSSRSRPWSSTSLRREAAGFVGETMQVPPMVSALKHEGKRLYDLARKGIEVERAPRPVRIDRFEITAPRAAPHRLRAGLRSGHLRAHAGGGFRRALRYRGHGGGADAHPRRTFRGRPTAAG